MSQDGIEDHTDAYDYGEHHRYYGVGGGRGGPDEMGGAPPPGAGGYGSVGGGGPQGGGDPTAGDADAPPLPFKGGNNEASLWLAVAFFGSLTAMFWLPPLIRLITGPRVWWEKQDVKNGWFSRWTLLKLIPVFCLVFAALSLTQYIEEDPELANYRLLGLSPDASIPTVKKTWRKLAKTLHPDGMKNPTEADRRRFERTQKAYQSILNPGESAEERLREKLQEEYENYGESIALPAFFLEKENKKYVMLGTIAMILVPLGAALYMLTSGAFNEKDPNLGPTNKRKKNNKK